jgi:hypothetical protein
MEPGDSLPLSQEPSPRPYPEPDGSSPYCDGFAQSIARQRLGKHPTTDVHATVEARPSLDHARNTRTQE